MERTPLADIIGKQPEGPTAQRCRWRAAELRLEYGKLMIDYRNPYNRSKKKQIGNAAHRVWRACCDLELKAITMMEKGWW
jgi:hypothetical protein